MVNYKTDSTEYMFCKKYWWLKQPILSVFSTAHINLCMLPWAKPAPFSVSQVHHHPNQSSAFTGLGQEDQHIDFALPGSALWWPGAISALWPFLVRNDKQMLSSLQAAGREAPKTQGALCNLAVTCGAAEQVCWCQTAHLQLTQPYRHCSPGEQLQLWLHNSILQPSVLVQVACYLWHIDSYWFHESGIHTGTGKCCKSLTHLEDYIHVLITFLVLHVNFC